MKSYVYLHGFASSPASRKAQFFSEKMTQHGIDLQIPALDGGDFEHLTISSQLELLRNLNLAAPLVLMGSSLGGYLAALYAEHNRDVERVVLLAPAFDFHARWAARMGPVALEQWQRAGGMPVYHYGFKRQCMLAPGLYEDAALYAPYPDVRQPALVMHGLQDDVVLPEVSSRFCVQHANATLRLFDSGHELTDVLEEIWAATEPFLFFSNVKSSD